MSCSIFSEPMSQLEVVPQAHDISVTDSEKIGYSRASPRAAGTDFCQKCTRGDNAVLLLFGVRASEPASQ